MIAASYPLVLWAPSGKVLDTLVSAPGGPKCQVSSSELVRYVERGYVQIIGRASWLWDEQFRRNHCWAGSVWTGKFDGVLKSICKADERLPDEEKRVRIVEDEKGYEQAEAIIGNDEGKVEKYWQLVEVGLIPIGSRERIEKKFGKIDPSRTYSFEEKSLAVREILRDVLNHSRAIQLANTKVPFLHPEQDDYLRIMAEEAWSPVVSQAKDLGQLRELGSETLELLDVLENIQPHSKLDDFLRDEEGRAELAKWLDHLSMRLCDYSPEDVAIFLTGELEDQVQHGVRRQTVLDVVLGSGKLAKTVTLLGLITALIGIPYNPTNLLMGAAGWTGLGTAVIPSGTGILKKLGILSAEYSGPQWPFLYAFGRAARTNELNALLVHLEGYYEQRKVGK